MKVIVTKEEAEIALREFALREPFGQTAASFDFQVEVEMPKTQQLEGHFVTNYSLARMVEVWHQTKRDKIASIKDIRTITGWGLKRSKDFYEDCNVPF